MLNRAADLFPMGKLGLRQYPHRFPVSIRCLLRQPKLAGGELLAFDDVTFGLVVGGVVGFVTGLVSGRVVRRMEGGTNSPTR